jgi:serine/threonine-protein kinase
MGVVWAAMHTVTRARVALKLLKPESTLDPVRRARFMREARAASAVRHPNIIEIRDFLELEDGALAMVMDLLEGESLGARLSREGTMPVEAVAPIMLQVVSAIGTAHATGIVHRDLKPDNIFLVAEQDGVSVRVLDFGIAKSFSAVGELHAPLSLTRTGAILGTPFYMAPEQLFGEKDIDARADVWSLGVILYECLAGRRPTEADNVGQILRIVAVGDIPPLRDAAPRVPEDVAGLVDGMLQRDRAKRPASLVEAYATLARHAPGLATRAFGEPAAPPPRATEPPTESPGAQPPTAQPLEQEAPRVRVIAPQEVGPSLSAAALATTAATTSDRRPGGAVRRRSRRALGGALAAAAVVGGALLFAGTRSASRSTATEADVVTLPSASSLPSPPPSAAADAQTAAATVDTTSAAAAPPSAPTAPAAHGPVARPRPPSAPAARPTPLVNGSGAVAPSQPATPASGGKFDPYEHM